MSDRIFKIKSPHMTGSDIEAWQREVKALFAKMKIDCPIVADGDYGVATRSYTASLCRANGLVAHTSMEKGVTPQLRIKLRNVNDSLSKSERAAKASGEIVDYRAALRKRWNDSSTNVHQCTAVIITDDWGFHPGRHDGVDVITPPDAVIFAMVKSKVIDVRPAGWWGLGAPSNPSIKAKGDGIIQLEVLETVGPFKKGFHIGYGHAEKARVKVGDVVGAGKAIGHAGLANAWYIHLMYNDGSTTRGVGNRDPRPLIDYAAEHSFR